MSTIGQLPTAAKTAAPLNMELGPSDSDIINGRTIIAYGESGLGKSTNARFFAQYYFEQTGLPVRLISAEDSSKQVFDPLIRLGIVEAVFLTRCKDPLGTLRRLTRGESIDGKTALAPNQISAYIFEGLTSIAELLGDFFCENQMFLREQKADAVVITKEGRVVSGEEARGQAGEKLAPNSQSGIYVVQNEMIRLLKSAGMLPVKRVLWTAHETKGKDDDTGAIIRGPALVGSAATGRLQKYCGTLLHFDGILDGSGMIKPRIYFTRHADANSVVATKTADRSGNVSVNFSQNVAATAGRVWYPAKTTVPVERLVELNKQFPGGYFDPGLAYGAGMDKFLATEAELLTTTTSDIEKWRDAALAKHRAPAA